MKVVWPMMNFETKRKIGLETLPISVTVMLLPAGVGVISISQRPLNGPSRSVSSRTIRVGGFASVVINVTLFPSL